MTLSQNKGSISKPSTSLVAEKMKENEKRNPNIYKSQFCQNSKFPPNSKNIPRILNELIPEKQINQNKFQIRSKKNKEQERCWDRKQT